jgi:hypothetical protein
VHGLGQELARAFLRRLRQRHDGRRVLGGRAFPVLSPQPGAHGAALSAPALSEYRARFDATRGAAEIPLLDLDDVEEHSGCHSRTGESVYIDGITGAVSPCLRVPFAPDDCRIAAGSGRTLAEVLSGPYFTEYRARTGPCPSWCGADLASELADVQRILEEHGGRDARLDGYRQRSPSGVRRLPVIPGRA